MNKDGTHGMETFQTLQLQPHPHSLPQQAMSACSAHPVCDVLSVPCNTLLSVLLPWLFPACNTATH